MLADDLFFTPAHFAAGKNASASSPVCHPLLRAGTGYVVSARRRAYHMSMTITTASSSLFGRCNIYRWLNNVGDFFKNVWVKYLVPHRDARRNQLRHYLGKNAACRTRHILSRTAYRGV